MKYNFHKILALAVTMTILASTIIVGTTGKAAASPVNPNASQEVRDLLSYLYSVSGNKIISGQHNKVSDPDYYSDKIYTITGKYAGIWGCDFSYGSDLSTYRQELVNEAKRQWSAGSIVTLMYHQVFPTDSDTAGWNSCHPGSPISQDLFNNVVTPGTTEYNAWKAKMDTIASYLQQLEDAHVPVIWRPYHEMNGGWFWWGQQPKYKDLYIQTYNYLTNTKGLNNLIWVWNANSTPSSTYYPGSSYVDVVATDIYGGNSKFTSTTYNTCLSIANGKPIAVAECGDLPYNSTLDSQPEWAWLMLWDESNTDYNSDTEIKSFINYSRTLTRDEINIGSSPTPTPTPISTTIYEAEDLTKTASDTTNVVSDSTASGGSWVSLVANTTGDYIQFTVNVTQTGTYNVKYRYKAYNSRGKYQLSIGGTNQGSEVDQYASSATWREVDLGNVSFSSTGSKTFKFSVTGKNSSSSGYTGSVDYIKLTKQ